MLSYPIAYDEPLFRPPAEAQSLILQVTLGCSWNQCAFCDMYASKTFRVRPQAEIFADIEAFVPYAQYIRRVFLADGDPLVLSTNKLLPILSRLKASFPRLTRISAYASPGNLNRKETEELEALKEAGLDLIYVGIESGDDTVLKQMRKGESFASTVMALQRAHRAGIKSSVMIINGLGGSELSKQHAMNSARLLNETQPRYISTLVLSHYKGLAHFRQRLQQEFTPLTQKEQYYELKLFIEHLALNESIFRSDHVSNSLVLKGVLGKDKEILLSKIKQKLQSL